MLMAKRTTSRSKTTDPAASAAEPKPKRARRAAAPESSTPSGAESTADDRRTVEPTVDDIRERAYHRYLERGGDHGQHFDDWLEAERELRIKSKK
jgi:hypothetical protein